MVVLDTAACTACKHCPTTKAAYETACKACPNWYSDNTAGELARTELAAAQQPAAGNSDRATGKRWYSQAG